MSIYPTALQNDTFIQIGHDGTADVAVRAERTDKQLIDLVLVGDATAFEEIFERHKKLVAFIAGRYFRRPEEVEEIIQIAFAKAFVELGTFQGKYDRSFSSWLVKITSNACLDTLRKQKRKPERLNCDLSEFEAVSLIELTADNSMLAERTLLNRDLVEKLLAQLPVEDRILLQMLYADEMSVADIAEVFGWSVSKVKIRAWRSRIAVRKVLRKFM